MIHALSFKLFILPINTSRNNIIFQECAYNISWSLITGRFWYGPIDAHTGKDHAFLIFSSSAYVRGVRQLQTECPPRRRARTNLVPRCSHSAPMVPLMQQEGPRLHAFPGEEPRAAIRAYPCSPAEAPPLSWHAGPCYGYADFAASPCEQRLRSAEAGAPAEAFV